MTALSTLIEPLKRELAVPGTFADLFPNTTDADLLGSLADAFGQSQLYGFFPENTLEYQAAVDNPDPTPDVAADWLVDPDLSPAGGAMVVIFASLAFIRAQLRSINQMERYKAGSVEYETSKAASVLQEEMRFLQKRLDDLVDMKDKEAQVGAGMASVYDNYLARGGLCPGGFYAHEYH